MDDAVSSNSRPGINEVDLDARSIGSGFGGKALTEMDGLDAFSNMQKGKKDKNKSEKKGKSKRQRKQILNKCLL